MKWHIKHGSILFIKHLLWFSEIGVGLAGFGVAFVFLGVLLLFDRGLLAIGNVSIGKLFHSDRIFQRVLFFQILFICGLACIIGLERTFRFFVQRKKIKSSLAFFGGIIIVLMGYPLIGMVIESYGFFLLFRYSSQLKILSASIASKHNPIYFSGFFPVAINFLRRVPILGRVLNLPGINTVIFGIMHNNSVNFALPLTFWFQYDYRLLTDWPVIQTELEYDRRRYEIH